MNHPPPKSMADDNSEGSPLDNFKDETISEDNSEESTDDDMYFLGELPLATDVSISWLHRPGIVFSHCQPELDSDGGISLNKTMPEVEEGFPPNWYQGDIYRVLSDDGHRIDPRDQPHRRWMGDIDWRQIMQTSGIFSPATDPFIRAAHHTHLRLNRNFLLGEAAGWLPKLRFGVGDRVWARWSPPEDDDDETKDYGDDVVRCEGGNWAPGTIIMPYWRDALQPEQIAENKEETVNDHQCYLRYNGHYPFRNAAGDDEKDPLLRAKKTQDAMRRALPPTRQSYSIMAYQIVLDPTETVLRTLGLVSKDGIPQTQQQTSGLIYAFMDDNRLVRSQLENGRLPPAEFAMDEHQTEYMWNHLFEQLLCPSWWMMPGGYNLEDLAGIEDVDIDPGCIGRGLIDIELTGVLHNPTLYHPDLVSAIKRRAKYLGYENEKRDKKQELDQVQSAAINDGLSPYERLVMHLGGEGDVCHSREALRLVRRDGREKSECVVCCCLLLLFVVVVCCCCCLLLFVVCVTREL